MISSRNNEKIDTADTDSNKWYLNGKVLSTEIFNGGQSKEIGFGVENDWTEYPQDFGFGGIEPNIFERLRPVVAVAGSKNGAKLHIIDAKCAENGDTFQYS